MSGKSQKQVTDDLGVAMSTLSRWCSELAANGERAFVGSGNLQPEAEELRRLRRENEVLRQERDILKRGMLLRSTTADEPGYTWKEGSQRTGRSSRLISLELG
ncbi:hypothetical protein [Ktedonospora formicarum]|nr:hypothetical protein [Ktedonospora formicarum]